MNSNLNHTVYIYLMFMQKFAYGYVPHIHSSGHLPIAGLQTFQNNIYMYVYAWSFFHVRSYLVTHSTYLLSFNCMNAVLKLHCWRCYSPDLSHSYWSTPSTLIEHVSHVVSLFPSVYLLHWTYLQISIIFRQTLIITKKLKY